MCMCIYIYIYIYIHSGVTWRDVRCERYDPASASRVKHM